MIKGGTLISVLQSISAFKDIRGKLPPAKCRPQDKTTCYCDTVPFVLLRNGVRRMTEGRERREEEQMKEDMDEIRGGHGIQKEKEFGRRGRKEGKRKA